MPNPMDPDRTEFKEMEDLVNKLHIEVAERRNQEKVVTYLGYAIVGLAGLVTFLGFSSLSDVESRVERNVTKLESRIDAKVKDMDEALADVLVAQKAAISEIDRRVRLAVATELPRGSNEYKQLTNLADDVVELTKKLKEAEAYYFKSLKPILEFRGDENSTPDLAGAVDRIVAEAGDRLQLSPDFRKENPFEGTRAG